VLEWGHRARVVDPPELVDRVRTELEGALKGYAKRK
jgi:predicted DNA-binding transcriptional regulator YafY